MNRGTRILMLVVLAAASAAILETTQASSTSASTLYVAPGGSDSADCSRSSPCASFNRAYARATPGATVLVAPGRYPTQVIDSTVRRSGPNVVFSPQGASKPTVADIEVTNGSHIEFRDFVVPGDTYARAGAQYVTFRRITMGLFFVRGADHIRYLDSDVGPNDANDYMNWISAAYDTQDAASDVVLDHVRIHDFVKHQESSHVDCIGIDDVNGLVIRNSRIWHCEHFAIIFGNDSSTDRAARNVVLENNFFDCCVSGYYAIGFGGADGKMLVRFNTSDNAFGWLNGPDLVPDGLITIDSNVIDYNSRANCDRATWRFNVVRSGASCGGGGRVGSVAFRAPPSDLHLRGRTAAAGEGNPKAFPARDIDGNLRPRNKRPDAGADQSR